MKLYLHKSVYEAGIERLKNACKFVDRIAIAYSGGKDSCVSMYLTLESISSDKEIYVYFIDKESNLISTRNYIEREYDRLIEQFPNVKLLWIALPLKEINAMSFNKPYWYCWDEKEREKWIYEPPEKNYVITQKNNILKNYGYDPENKYIYGVINRYLSENGKYKVLVVVGLRADESLNRYRAVTKYGHFDMDCITKVSDMVYNIYPIYDWDFRDIFKYISDNNIELNPIYHQMWLKGIFKREMRISQSFAGVPKKTMPLYREMEPESFERFLNRVDGVNSLTHIDLSYIKKISNQIQYDYLYECLPQVYKDALNKTQRNTKDTDTIKAILNGDIRLKRKNKSVNNSEQIKKKWNEKL